MKTFESTFYWLKKDDFGFPYVIAEAIENMHAAVDNGNISAAQNYRQQSKASDQLVDDLGKARINIECAKVALKAQIPSIALEEIIKAISMLDQGTNRPTSFRHTEAMTIWMLGNLLMLDTIRRVSVAATWRKSLKIFENLAFDPATFLSDRTWYQERCDEMRQAISEANQGIPVKLPSVRATLNAGSMRSINVLSVITAGGLSNSGVVSTAPSQIILQPSLDEIRINGSVHHLYNLRGIRDLITLHPGSDYSLLEVAGDSMNMTGVEHGDYVLLQIQGSAENGDMLASEIVTKDDRAVLRTFIGEGDKVVLCPQSDNSIHRTYQFDDLNGVEYNIHGIVIGVLKSEKLPPAHLTEDQPSHTTESQPPTIEEEIISQSNFLRAFPVYEDIPAGGPQAVPVKSNSYADLASFRIDDQIYFLKNLRSSGHVINPGRDEIIVLKVTGDNMDKADISEGDFVILNRSIAPQSQDIVAAEIRDVDDCATLKRYLLQPGKAVLAPESSNEVHQPLEFDHSDDEPPFYIQGVASQC